MTSLVPSSGTDEKFGVFLEKMGPQIERVLPKMMRVESVVQAALVAAVRNPEIIKCTKQSIALAILKASSLGLDIGEDIHLVPLKNKVSKRGEPDAWEMQCEAWPDYKGLIRLARDARIINNMVPYVVRQGDRFDYELGLQERLQHRPTDDSAKNTAPITHAYAIIWLPFSAKTFHVMPIADIEAIRAKSRAWKGEAACPGWFAKKTVIRDWLNRQPKKGRLAAALEADDLEPSPDSRPAHVSADGEIIATVEPAKGDGLVLE